MFSHVTIGANDPGVLSRFYDAVLAPLGVHRFFTDPARGVTAWRAAPAGPALYVGPPIDGAPATAGNGTMVAIRAPDRAAVAAAHAAAIAAGGRCAGPPGPRPNYAPDYYGAYWFDPEGNKMHAVHRTEWGVLPGVTP